MIEAYAIIRDAFSKTGRLDPPNHTGAARLGMALSELSLLQKTSS